MRSKVRGPRSRGPGCGTGPPRAPETRRPAVEQTSHAHCDARDRGRLAPWTFTTPGLKVTGPTTPQAGPHEPCPLSPGAAPGLHPPRPPRPPGQPPGRALGRPQQTRLHPGRQAGVRTESGYQATL